MIDPLSFLAGGGEAARMIRARDWTGHPLGAPEVWPSSLKVALSLVLNSPESMILSWGPDLHFFFNDAYFPLLGPRLSWAMGARFDEVWADAMAQALPIIEAAMAGESRRFVDLPWKLATDRGAADTWWTFSYSRVLEADGSIAGLFIFTNETTEAVLNAAAVRANLERQEFLLGLEGQLRLHSDPAPIILAAVAALGRQLGAHQVAYADVDECGAVATVEYDWNDGPIPSNAGAHRLDDYGPDFAADLRAGRPIVVADISADPRTASPLSAESFERASVGAFMLVPIADDGRLKAAFCINQAAPRAWTAAELALARDAADRTWATIVRARADAALRESEGRLRFLDELARATAGLVEADALLTTTTRMVATHMGLSICAYADMDEDEDGFTIRGEWTAPGAPSLLGHFRLRDFGEATHRRLGSGETLVIDDSRAELPPQEAAAFQALGISATVCMPLVKNGRLTALMAGHRREAHRWTAAEIALIREVSERSWAHIERAGAAAELKATAGALAALNATLEERVRARTSELMRIEEVLRQSQKMEAVGQLTGGLAHDFNNLLAGISGSIELVESRLAQGRGDEVARYLANAMGATKRAAALTHRLLAFSRRQTLAPKATDINRLVAEMADLVRRTVGPAIEVATATDGELWPVLADPNQLENALLNLCINSRDAMPDGGRLVVRTANLDLGPDAAAERRLDLPPGQYVVLSVSDDGTGMSADVIEKAFDPFFTTKPIGVGTGLGLSMIYGFAQQSGGQARIESTQGRGTTVSIVLPRHHSPEALAEDVRAAPAQPMAKASETILVIDDEPLIRMLIVDVVQDLGYVAIEAGDGPEGMEVLRSAQHLDLLITDVGLPNGMNGRQVADAARELRPDLKVLFVTGYAETAVLGHGHLAPGMEVMTKPFQMEELGRRIETLIARG
ncbi:GAF domain-containing protein [Aureimonas endophytica]|nr:GAF domain-containing protein [Aureimonas endophytica]